ncbi:TetR/AcrR family transcriptional regulator [Pseudomonas cyclaminis]|uniref:TetR/AcrR family transcriptional regulator n=1 Tax=Pseudomonas cyclaminis TaxID=2781239 RepID=UPI0038210710
MPITCNNSVSQPATDQPPQIKHSRHVETREKAVTLFARRGFSQVGLRELATHLGINAGSIYNHIESKEALLFELIETLYEDLIDIVTRPIRTAVPAEKQLNDLITAHLDLHEEKSDFFRVAEHDFHCLEAKHQTLIVTLRQRYESHLIALLKPIGISPNHSMATATVRTFSCMLNNLPAWTANIGLDPKAHRIFLRNIALSVVRGAMEKPSRAVSLSKM